MAIVAVTFSAWPSIDKIELHPSFLYRMSEAAQAVMNRAGLPTRQELEPALVEADRKGAVDDARRLAVEIPERRKQPAWSEDPIVLAMPNGHQILVTAQTTDTESALVTREYARVLTDELHGRRQALIMRALLTWLLPVLGTCALAFLARWVYRGFRRPPP
jgi:hypothetical protein